MTALPPVNEVLNSPTDANAMSLYSKVLQAEAAASNHELNLIRSRILGYLILYPLNDQSRARILLEIASCNRQHDSVNENLYQLGEFYLQHFIRPFRKTKGTPVPSSHPSRPSFDQLQESIEQVLQHTPRDHETAQSSALIRDDFRCMVTGVVDRVSARKYKKVAEQAVGKRIMKTECCYIFPQSTNSFQGRVGECRVDYAAGVWSVLNIFGYQEIREELEGSKIHRLENVMMLTTDIHDMMASLELWFEEIEDKENCYRIQVSGPDPQLFMKGGDIPSQVQFIAHHNLPLPSPKYLRIHAACCKVAHLSGAAEYLDRISRDMEELPVLAEDGASADVLTHALLHLAVPPD